MSRYTFKIFGWYILSVFLMIFFSQKCSAQTLVNDKTFEITQKGVSIVEFWAEWNKENECSWLKDIDGVDWYRIDVYNYTTTKYEIEVLPTLILFNEGKEVERYVGNVAFEICSIKTSKKIEEELKKIYKDD